MARKMPQNLDAEMSVLGVCFLDDRVVSKVLEEVTGTPNKNETKKDTQNRGGRLTILKTKLTVSLR